MRIWEVADGAGRSTFVAGQAACRFDTASRLLRDEAIRCMRSTSSEIEAIRSEGTALLLMAGKTSFAVSSQPRTLFIRSSRGGCLVIGIVSFG